MLAGLSLSPIAHVQELLGVVLPPVLPGGLGSWDADATGLGASWRCNRCTAAGILAAVGGCSPADEQHEADEQKRGQLCLGSSHRGPPNLALRSESYGTAAILQKLLNSHHLSLMGNVLVVNLRGGNRTPDQLVDRSHQESIHLVAGGAVACAVE